MKDHKISFFVDVGGTFTDCIFVDSVGHSQHCKVLSSGQLQVQVTESKKGYIEFESAEIYPDDFFCNWKVEGYRGKDFPVELHSNSVLKISDLNDPPQKGAFINLKSPWPAPIVGIRKLLGLKASDQIPEINLDFGTTWATNALLQRKGAKFALVVTKGFKDLLTIGDQTRSDLFRLDIHKFDQLFHSVYEVNERVLNDGTKVTDLREDEVCKVVRQLKQDGIESVAVCFLNSYQYPQHEELFERIALRDGMSSVTLSSKVAPVQKALNRAYTTCVDAYLNPAVGSYFEEIRFCLPGSSIRVMTSAGILSDVQSLTAKDLILSGPAGGASGVEKLALHLKEDKVIGFDMGGTSTDVCVYEGQLKKRFEMTLLDYNSNLRTKVVSPMVEIDTIASGGGSICWYDGVSLRVGPESAGANPGPACFNRGGAFTITDCQLIIGRLHSCDFAFPLDVEISKKEGSKILGQYNRSQRNISIEELAHAFVKIAASNMAKSIRGLTSARGFQPSDYLLVAFGGAGAQISTDVAQELGVKKIVIPKLASLFSAYGISAANEAKQKFRSGSFTIAEWGEVKSIIRQLKMEIQKEFNHYGLKAPVTLTFKCRLEIRYVGQDLGLQILVNEDTQAENCKSLFRDQHLSKFGFTFEDRGIEIRTIFVEGLRDKGSGLLNDFTKERLDSKARNKTKIYASDLKGSNQWMDCDRITKDSLSQGQVVQGPKVIVGDYTSIFLSTGWQAIDKDGQIILTETLSNNTTPSLAKRDPVLLSLFQNRLTTIAEIMGRSLGETAISVNIKERLDYSCAIFSREGDLVINAPHIPVHLGSMSSSLKTVIRLFPNMEKGDVFIMNDPYEGGSHLPDVTVVKPIFSVRSGKLIYFVGNRAHHAELGGITPGSMPPFSKCLEEEGVIIAPQKLVDRGVFQEKNILKVLQSGPYPSRAAGDNISDLLAQIGACQIGEHLLEEYASEYSEEFIIQYMNHLQDIAQEKTVLACLELFKNRSSLQFVDTVDQGLTLAVRFESLDMGESVKVSFKGTCHSVPSNFNANPAIVRAALIYSIRCLIADEMPLNEGVFRVFKIDIPEDSILDPRCDGESKPAVVAGNIETSQRIVDIILGAFGIAAASQGTMNNITIGSEAGQHFKSYYETVCGGAGAGEAYSGANAVHTHMTNTRITDLEIIEERFPFYIKEFSIRENSGGRGRQSGGHGVVRHYVFRDSVSLSILSTRRNSQPFGMNGAEGGQSGENYIVKKTGMTKVPGCYFGEMNSGDELILKTPGGGGFN